MTEALANYVFCVLSFEGPDRYAQAGGLGVRVTHLSESLASQGYETHLFFIGDPERPGREEHPAIPLSLHRWSQWISQYHPNGVYDGEEGKWQDYTQSIPGHIFEAIIKPALSKGQTPVILAEEWHTAATTIAIHQLLLAAGLREQVVIFWNANNTMSFERLDWRQLGQAAQLTTVSRYMKHLMWQIEQNPLVIPNGIPGSLTKLVPAEQVEDLRRWLAPDPDTVMLFKVGRFDPAKCWLTAIETAAMLKASGQHVVFPLRGGIEAHGHDVLGLAAQRGLRIQDVRGEARTWQELGDLLQAQPPADIYNLQLFLTQEMLRPFYAAADAVLANSGHEPFGLVGLEAMAAGGIVFTGSTGEEYVMGGRYGLALDTALPSEIVVQIQRFQQNPQRAEELRRNARYRAAEFSWLAVSQILLDKIQFIASTQGIDNGVVPEVEPAEWPVFLIDPPRLTTELVAAD